MAITLFLKNRDKLKSVSERRWGYMALGVLLIVAGLIVLGDVVTATIVSAVLIGLIAIVVGAVEIFYSIFTKEWERLIWHILLGCLYIVGGIALVTSPLSGSVTLTYVLGFVLAASGLVRMIFGIRALTQAGGLMLLSGLFGIVAGVLILAQWPSSGLWTIGLFLGIDLAIHGAGWLALALAPSAVRP
jgi:uncharacterized membrane protein HdeD (DUF308 family)